MMYKYELHAHTKEVSRCGTVPAAELVKMYKDIGYSGIVITDHYSPMTFNLATAFLPQKAMDYYLNGYKTALNAAGDDFSVLLGIELRYYATANDYLVYGVTEELLKSSGNLMAMYPRRFYAFAKKNSLLVVQAHPFRSGMIRTNPRFLDGAEVFNGKAEKEANAKSLNWASENNMKLMLSGSDFHRKKNLGKGGIITDRPVKTNDGLLNVLLNNEFERIESASFE